METFHVVHFFDLAQKNVFACQRGAKCVSASRALIMIRMG